MIPGTRLFGHNGKLVQLSDQFIQKIGPDLGPPVTASYVINNDGFAYDHDSVALEKWLRRGAYTAYQLRATLVSGTLSSGSTGPGWLSIAQGWTKTVGGTLDSVTITVEIRNASTLVVLDSADIILEAGTSI